MAGKVLDRIREYVWQDKLKFSKHAIHIDLPNIIFQQSISLEQAA